jgi:hypothetical protein
MTDGLRGAPSPRRTGRRPGTVRASMIVVRRQRGRPGTGQKSLPASAPRSSYRHAAVTATNCGLIDCWWPPAGHRRTGVDAVGVKYRPKRRDRHRRAATHRQPAGPLVEPRRRSAIRLTSSPTTAASVLPTAEALGPRRATARDAAGRRRRGRPLLEPAPVMGIGADDRVSA